MTYTLTVGTKRGCTKGIERYTFETIAEAYNFYVKHFATLGEKFYYLRTAHCSLKSITKESTMECIFYNVFTNAVITDR